jgi:uncharacterized membrane protein
MGEIINILHVVGAVFIVGPMAILPMTAMRSVRAGNAAQVATLAKSTYLFSLLSVLVVIFGFGALSMAKPEDNFTFGSTWIMLSIIFYVVAIAISLFVVVPTLRSVAEGLEGTPAPVDGALNAKPSGYGKIAAGSGIVAILLVAVVVLMVWKP